ncbi:hypothetical protein HA402_008986 [Bradysia odoriphaga]|nr:hypothetical protein HA402_008986 [Bradysia odoriphaga]
MAKYYETTATFNYSWEQVVKGFWNRYPNPHSLPKWGERFYNAKSVKIVEESVVDPKERKLTTYRNIAFTKVMSVVEKVVYKMSD